MKVSYKLSKLQELYIFRKNEERYTHFFGLQITLVETVYLLINQRNLIFSWLNVINENWSSQIRKMYFIVWNKLHKKKHTKVYDVKSK